MFARFVNLRLGNQYLPGLVTFLRDGYVRRTDSADPLGSEFIRVMTVGMWLAKGLDNKRACPQRISNGFVSMSQVLNGQGAVYQA